MNEIGVEEARQTLGELVALARMTGQPTRLTRYGKPAAVIVSPDWYEKAVKALGKEKA
jgi:prevent-host-death family protein